MEIACYCGMCWDCCLLVQAPFASAALTIEIIGAGEHQIPVAIVPFGGDGNLAQTINSVVTGDLQRTGLFRLVDPAGKSPHELAEVSYPDWQSQRRRCTGDWNVSPSKPMAALKHAFACSMWSSRLS